jgi:hypothetical protein
MGNDSMQYDRLLLDSRNQVISPGDEILQELNIGQI